MRTRGASMAGLAVLAAGALAAAGCSGGSKAPASSTTVATVGTTTTTTSTTTTTPGGSTTSGPGTTSPTLTSLADLILSAVPSGFVRQPDALASTGPTDLAKAARDDALVNPDAAHQILVSAGFVAGYQRQWQTIDGVDQNFVFLYEFSTPAGAVAYIGHWQSTITASSGLTLAPFTPPVIPGAVGLHGEDSNGSSAVVLFAKGTYAVQALVTGEPSTDQSTGAGELALAQYVRLP